MSVDFLTSEQRKKIKDLLVFLGGPRFLDPPLRIFALLIALLSLLPGGGESSEFVYTIFRIVAGFLIAFAPFQVYIAGFAGFAGFLIFPLFYPNLLNPFQTVSEFVAAVTLTYLNWRFFIIFSALLFAAQQLTGLYSQPITVGELTTFVLSWFLISVLGLFAGLFESMIQKEVGRREEAARLTQAEIEQLRIKFVLDTHDTVSHGLATEAAILRMLGRDAARGINSNRDSRIMEVALVNAHTQQQLRSLLSRLKTGSGFTEEAVVTFSTDLYRSAELIMSATEAGGFELDIQIEKVPLKARVEELNTALFLLRELATNIVKHASSKKDCSIHVWAEPSKSVLHFRTTNKIEDDEVPLSKSLTTRTEQHGGTIRAETSDGIYTLNLEIPLRENNDPNTSIM